MNTLFVHPYLSMHCARSSGSSQVIVAVTFVMSGTAIFLGAPGTVGMYVICHHVLFQEFMLV